MGLPYPSTTGARSLFAVITYTDHLLLLWDTRYPCRQHSSSIFHQWSRGSQHVPSRGPGLSPWPSHGVVIQPRIKSSLYMQLLCLQSTHCELRLMWNLIMKIQAYYAQWVPVTLSTKTWGIVALHTVRASFRKATLEISLNDMKSSLVEDWDIDVVNPRL